MSSPVRAREDLGEIFHRLRNPVAGIRTTAQVLLGRFDRRGDVPESWTDLVNRIITETRNLEAAIEALESGLPAPGRESDRPKPAVEE